MRAVAFWLLLAFVFVIPWENMVVLGSLGTVGRVSGLLVAGFWIMTAVATGRFRKITLFHVMIFLFVLWNAVSIFWSVNTKITAERAETYAQLVIFVFILWDLCTTTAAVHAVLQAYVLGAYVSIGGLGYNYIMLGGVEYHRRLSASGFNENDLALILVLGLPVAWYLAVAKAQSKLGYGAKLINVVYIPAAVLGIILTASRGAALAAVPAFLFIFMSLTQLKIYQRILLFVGLVGALFLLQPLIPPTALERLANTGKEVTEGDLNERLPVWREGIGLFSRQPFLGVGSGAFRDAATETGKGGHNVALSILVEVGIVGFTLFAIILAMVFYRALNQPKWISRLWVTVLMVWLLGGMSHTMEEKKRTWLFFSLAAISASLYAQRERQGARALQQEPQLNVNAS